MFSKLNSDFGGLTSSYEAIQISTTTGETYGECQIYYTDKGKTPIVIANTANNNMLITINNISATSCQFIVRSSNGEILKKASVTINALIIWNGSTIS